MITKTSTWESLGPRGLLKYIKKRRSHTQNGPWKYQIYFYSCWLLKLFFCCFIYFCKHLNSREAFLWYILWSYGHNIVCRCNKVTVDREEWPLIYGVFHYFTQYLILVTVKQEYSTVYIVVCYANVKLLFCFRLTFPCFEGKNFVAELHRSQSSISASRSNCSYSKGKQKQNQIDKYIRM